MEDNILIISDKVKQIPYDSILSFFSYKIIDPLNLPSINISSFSLVILDIDTSKECIGIGNKIREICPNSSILIISNFENPMEHFSFTKLKGYGQVKILRYRKSYPEVLLEFIQSMLHPEFPSKKGDIAIILPVYNEESRFNNVYDFVNNLKVLLNDSFMHANIYFVNDGSKDNTQDLIDKLLKSENEETNIISNKSSVSSYALNINTRKAGTYLQGIREIDASILIFADADNSFTIEDIAKIINILNVGYYDMVAGTKDETAENRPLVRKIMSFSKRLLTKSLLPKGIYDSQTGLKGMTSFTARTILPYLHEDTGLAIDLEMLYIAKKLNLRVLQLPVTCIDREGSHVRIIKDSISFIKNIIKLKTVNKDIKIKEVDF